jgi:hypothetical protein
MAEVELIPISLPSFLPFFYFIDRHHHAGSIMRPPPPLALQVIGHLKHVASARHKSRSS